MTLWTTIGLVAGLAATYLLYEGLESPVLWLLPLWALACFWLAIRRGRSPARVAWYLAGWAVVYLLVAELFFFAQRTPRPQAVHDAGDAVYVEPHESLGYAPHPGVRVHASKLVEGTALYDVHYTIGANGLRVTPRPSGAEPPERCVLFFGGSFTFGEAVEDGETLPARVAARVGERFEVHNFGFSGYGPHQMLAAIEEGLVEQAIDCRPSHAVYQLIRNHVRRAAGAAPWDTNGPRYLFDDEGRVVRRGQFEPSGPPEWLADLADRSHLVDWLLESGFEEQDSDYDLTIGILARARSELTARWPGLQFLVLSWAPRDGPLDERLLRNGLPVIRVSDRIPGLDDPDAPYLLSKDERHPTPRAHDVLAEAVAERLD
jgi:hypothetical protein